MKSGKKLYNNNKFYTNAKTYVEDKWKKIETQTEHPSNCYAKTMSANLFELFICMLLPSDFFFYINVAFLMSCFF